MLTTEERQRNPILKKLHLDGPLLLGLLALAVTSLFVVYSASGESEALVWRQAIRVSAAFVGLFIIAQFPPRFFERFSPILFGFGLLLLVAVLLFGEVGKGAQRWLDIGPVTIQPSEIMKLAVPMMIAWYVNRRAIPIRLGRLVIALTLVLIPVLLIAKQPDLGTSLLVASAGIFVIFLAGLSWRLITVAVALVAAFTPILWMYLMHDYQRQRVLTFLNPERDPLGSGYHIIQSKIAIGSGGIDGKGWLQGTQSQLEFLPERHTDFIFSVFSEEFGLIGVTLLLALYGFVILRGLIISLRAQDIFSKLLGGALTLTFFVYVFVNIGMVSGLLPVVGVPLPLISYGGTSMVTILAGFGILMSIATHHRLIINQ
ncbi:MAG: rod shape-determining protein RodA [Idiomarina sp.]|jgi:rod shape determining protein RodA|uniref:Peptidoglycan glycosyltransferase MrdB n=1 Tax=Idiomarina aquatica TaxID=1327752 RepID=A0A4R6PKQ7_9GAMM|nr:MULTISPECIES: rod shape-determining protein RodA [Idiomarina]MAK71576.1 rod shape-determining protein RodA [Idiomarinaceae bacterium]MBL4742675.1 rod shape-determining protein RodA [Idiomarina sp.]MBT42756.1 rod shape-determining protein RodA [Idiomarina sp.]PHQ75142.1 MAG: rod shape-determining protein RodA [Idiomarina sp.]TDP39024.1 cell elongation-specific peptidoglycan biosynthesis regulator RodA [Idiomarina aquatica]